MPKKGDAIDALLDTKKQEAEDAANAEKWDPDAGDTIRGYLVKTGWYTGGTYPPSLWLLIKTDDGDDVRVYCKTVLRGQVLEEEPAIGSGIAIRYEGRETSQAGRKYDSYTMVLIPDDEGNVKRDHAYWLEAGVEPVKRQQTQAQEVDASDMF